MNVALKLSQPFSEIYGSVLILRKRCSFICFPLSLAHWLHFCLTIQCDTTELQPFCKSCTDYTVNAPKMHQSPDLLVSWYSKFCPNCPELEILTELIVDLLGFHRMSSSGYSKMRQKFQLILQFHWWHKWRWWQGSKEGGFFFFFCAAVVFGPQAVSQHCSMFVMCQWDESTFISTHQ